MAKANQKKMDRKEAKIEQGIKITVKEDASRQAKLHLILGPIVVLVFAALFFVFVNKPYKNIQKNAQEDIKVKVINSFSDDVKKNSNRLAKNIKSMKSLVKQA